MSSASQVKLGRQIVVRIVRILKVVRITFRIYIIVRGKADTSYAFLYQNSIGVFNCSFFRDGSVVIVAFDFNDVKRDPVADEIEAA